MPNIDGRLVDPEHAIASGYCPECGEKLEGTKAARTHLAHWPDNMPKLAKYDEAHRRREMLKDYFSRSPRERRGET